MLSIDAVLRHVLRLCLPNIYARVRIGMFSTELGCAYRQKRASIDFDNSPLFQRIQAVDRTLHADISNN